MPALFIHGEDDDFIKQHHSHNICEVYKGPKNLLVVEGDHNDPRPPKCLLACQSFLKQHVNALEEWDLLQGRSIENPMYPPWYHKSVVGSSGFDDKTIGMTTQRQQEIKSNINQMFGHQGPSEKEDDVAGKDSVEIGLPASS